MTAAWDRILIRSAHPGATRIIDHLVRGRSVRRVPGVGVLVAGPEAVRQVLGDTERFRKSGPGSSGALWTPVLGEGVLLNMDGADHRALRTRLANLFARPVVERVCRIAVAPLLERAGEQLRAGDPVDLVVLSRTLAGAAISQVVGLDPVRNAEVITTAADTVERLVGWRTATLSPRQVGVARRALAPVQQAAELAYRLGDPDTVMGRLAADGIDLPQARALAAALVLTGTGTVAAAAPRLVAHLVDAGIARPGAEVPSVDDLVDEGLRVTTPSLATLRSVAEATEIGGEPVRPGDRIVLLLWWATRLAGGFQPGRTTPPGLRHLPFGAGPHFCLGQPLARAELSSLVTLLRDVAATRPLEIVTRRAARRVLVPRYAALTVRAR